jgi:hypothetical protein
MTDTQQRSLLDHLRHFNEDLFASRADNSNLARRMVNRDAQNTRRGVAATMGRHTGLN